MSISSLFKKVPMWLWVLLLATFMTLVFIAFPPERENVDETRLPWNSQFDTQGNLHALGLVLNKDTPTSAKVYFGEDIEVKLFSKKDETNKTAEVYFPSIHIGTIRGGLALSVAIDEAELNTMYDRGTQTTVTKVGNRQVSPLPSDIEALLSKPIKHITLVPKKNLPSRALEMRFGKPARIEKQSDGLEHWFYPEKGLEVLLDAEGPDALQYHIY